ncbi:exopolysaccharide biosynthesis polyprenyl glycosylphosphotransferase [Patulibacter defluvii]|uniref:exopolysaccharide biosynthesis polyprenyl glycosylphosphotransferase n=1 Tax=Patulibacter defluvii TaxID=3095358 RepID=UPI002A74959A|nr:exopolysaccharide biosynthesis polyprenyl glycosylphosphotransferase [Patulibacter sp. DM4]
MLLDARSLSGEATSAPEAAAAEAPTAARYVRGQRQSVRRRLLGFADIASFLGAVGLLLLARGEAIGGLAIPIALLGSAVLVVVAKILRLYDMDVQRLIPSTLDEVPRLVIAVSVTLAAIVFVVAPIRPTDSLTRWDLLALWVLTLLLLPPLRSAARALAHRVTPPERVAIVGDDALSSVLTSSFAYRPRHVTLVDVVPATGHVNHPGLASEIASRCLAHDVERVILVSDAFDADLALELLRQLRHASVSVSVVPRVAEETGARVLVEHLDGIGVMGVPPITRTRSTLVLKRAFDLLIAVPMVCALLPLMAVIALIVRLDSRGPVLFRQQRIGRNGEPFTMLKFRTMVDGAHEARAELRHLNVHSDHRLFKIPDDPRITRAGALLRRASLDELPQLFNVLRGDMSIVGPRPLVAEEDGHVVGWHRRRLDITPGLTGPWQVLQGHQVPFDAMVKIDYLYVLEWSPWTDVKIILRTLPVVLGLRSL